MTLTSNFCTCICFLFTLLLKVFILQSKRTLAIKQIFYRCFPVKFAQFLKRHFFKEHLRWLLLSFLKQKSKNEKIYFHKYIHRKTPVIVSFLVLLQAWGLTVLQKRDSVLDVCWKFVKCYEISFLQKTAGRLIPISSNISDLSLALLTINHLSHSWLYV